MAYAVSHESIQAIAWQHLATGLSTWNRSVPVQMVVSHEAIQTIAAARRAGASHQAVYIDASAQMALEYTALQKTIRNERTSKQTPQCRKSGFSAMARCY